jgi:transposase
MFDPSPVPEPVDYSSLLHELRCHETDALHDLRGDAVREQRQWHLRELAITRVLDERGQVDDSLAATDGVSTYSVRRSVRTARNLERQPHVAAAAARGALSDEQLDRVTDLVDPDDPGSDAQWAADGPRWSPADLAAELRRKRKPTVDDAAVRRAARELKFWWRADRGMLDGRFSLPDIDGALFETVFERLIESMRPAKGEPWATREHRGADALVELCRAYGALDPHAQTPGYRAHFVVQVPLEGPATVAGVPLPDAMVERLRADARIEPVLTREGEGVRVGRAETVLSEKIKRVVRQRDGHCRWPGCDRRSGLQVHHLWPRSWGGTDELWNTAAVCASHHALLAPQGDRMLLGNPHDPSGLHLVGVDDLAALAELAAAQARARPEAA